MLSQTGVAFEERELFRRPLTVEELRALLGDRPVSSLFATRSPRLKALSLKATALSDEEMLELMSKEPALIRRPLIQAGRELLIQPNASALDTLKG